MDSDSYNSPLLKRGESQSAQAEIDALKARVKHLEGRIKAHIFVLFLAVVFILALIVKYTVQGGNDPTLQLYSKSADDQFSPD